MKIIKEIGLIYKFIRESVRQFHYTGSIFPTSKWAAKEMTSPLRVLHSRTGRHILELGPGTGSVTVKILKDMSNTDELTLCEINPRFMSALKKALSVDPNFQQHKARVRFMCCLAQELPEDRKYDIIVCALPFLNFDLHTVREIFGKLQHLSSAHTVMTNYEYMGLRGISKMMSPPKRRRRIYQVDTYFRKMAPPLISRKKVWLNVLPIHIYTRRLAA